MVVLLRIRARLLGERGDALISGLLTLGLVLLVAALAIQLVGFAHCRNVAQAAAQDGAETAAAQGAGVGVVRAEAVLAAAGGAGAGLHASIQAGTSVITVTVSGQAPRVFPGVDLMLPAVSAHASVPVERYPTDETRQ